MSSKLYSKSEKVFDELKKSNDRMEKLSIEYNPLNQIRKDLQIVSAQAERDYEKRSKFVTVTLLQEKFEGSRVVDMESILEYCVSNSHTLRQISEYKSELSDKSIEAIKNFADKHKIDISRNRDNFFVLAPRKYFNSEIKDMSNPTFNIYYHDGFTRSPDKTSDLVEVYGSNFKSALLSHHNELLTITSADGDLFSPGAYVTTLLMMYGLLAIYVISGLCGSPCGIGGLLFYNVAVAVPMLALWYNYGSEISDGKYIKKLCSGTLEFFTKGKYQIKL